MYASTDGGAVFADSGAGFSGFHAGWGNGAICFDAANPDRFALFVYDYAMLLTENGGRTFEHRRLREQVRGWWGMYAGDLHPDFARNSTAIAAAGHYWRNQLVRTEDAGRTWHAIADTDGAYFFVRYHRSDPRVIYADDRRSDDGGRTFKRLERPVYAMAPSRPDTVYGYADGKVWRSDDRGDTWRALPDPPRRAGEHMGRRNIEVDPADSDRIWAMTPPGASTFDGKAWRYLDVSAWCRPAARAYAGRFAFDPANPRRIVIGLDALGDGYLFLSDDGGQTWNDITANLPRLGCNQSLAIQPRTGRLFIGSGFGTWTATIPAKE